jgi:DNA repair exonuclease SbcCD ATPase subunit
MSRPRQSGCSPSSATLLRGSEEIAVGVRPVNAKIAQILGFGLEVFDIACIANQGDIEKLGTMKPAERKRMVDTVIGLQVIEELARWAGDEALALSREADAIERTLVEPVRPVEPEGYDPSAELSIEIARLQALQRQLDGIEGWLSHRLEEPQEPRCEIAWTAGELKARMLDQMQEDADEAALQSRLASLPPWLMPYVRVKGFQIFRDRHGKQRCYHRKTRAAIDLEKYPIGSAEFLAECTRISALERDEFRLGHILRS